MAAKSTPTAAAARIARYRGTFELGAITFLAPELTEQGVRKRKPRCRLRVRHLRRQTELLEFLSTTVNAELDVQLFAPEDAAPLWAGRMLWHRYTAEGPKERDAEQGRQHGAVSFDLIAESSDVSVLHALVGARCRLCELDTFEARLVFAVVQAELDFEAAGMLEGDDEEPSDAAKTD